jgi:hypothetical protein
MTTSIVTTKSIYHSLRAQRLFERTVYPNISQVYSGSNYMPIWIFTSKWNNNQSIKLCSLSQINPLPPNDIYI